LDNLLGAILLVKGGAVAHHRRPVILLFLADWPIAQQIKRASCAISSPRTRI
jgi:hypothetical protein